MFMLCTAWLQVVEARRHVAVHHARVASGALPPAQQIAPITNAVFMVSTLTASWCSSSGSMAGPGPSSLSHYCMATLQPGNTNAD